MESAIAALKQNTEACERAIRTQPPPVDLSAIKHQVQSVHATQQSLGSIVNQLHTQTQQGTQEIDRFAVNLRSIASQVDNLSSDRLSLERPLNELSQRLEAIERASPRVPEEVRDYLEQTGAV